MKNNSRIIVTNGYALYMNKIKKMEMSREIEKLKLQSDKNNERYINLLKSRNKMNVEVEENNII